MRIQKTTLIFLLVPFISNAQFKNVFKKASEQATILTKSNSSIDIAAGLKEALNKGITEQVSKLTKTDGFYKNQAVKILMPEELLKVDSALRKMGMSTLADEGIKLLNRAAEEAVKEATPIIVSAIKNMTITDAKNILMGNETSATTYLQKSTTAALFAKFSPVVQTSLTKVGADLIWASVIKKYNSITLTKTINPDITNYVTNKTLDGVFKMILIEEKNIRSNLDSRTSELLKKVFALQDKK